METRGIISIEPPDLAKYRAVKEELTVLTMDSSIRLKRGDTVLANEEVYDVDRKLKQEVSGDIVELDFRVPTAQ